MPTLAKLESDRSKLLDEFLSLGDLRPGSITAVIRRCGKPTCHCAKPNDPGHDPQIRLTRRLAGKTITETFPNPGGLRKAQQEIAEFHRFPTQRRLGWHQRKDLYAPPRRAATGRLDRAGKKTGAAIHQEVTREVNQLLSRIFGERRHGGLCLIRLAAVWTQESARRVAEFRGDPAVQERIDLLSEQANEGLLSDDDRTEYEAFINAADFISSLKIKARRQPGRTAVSDGCHHPGLGPAAGRQSLRVLFAAPGHWIKMRKQAHASLQRTNVLS